MTSNLDDIWTEEPSSNLAAVDDVPLFLPDPPQPELSLVDANNPTFAGATNRIDTDFDKLFDDDLDFNIVPALDEAELMRQANAKYARHAIASSMQNDPLKISDSQPIDTQTGKKSRVIPKLDDERYAFRSAVIICI
jgi:hypothetical protein